LDSWVNSERLERDETEASGWTSGPSWRICAGTSWSCGRSVCPQAFHGLVGQGGDAVTVASFIAPRKRCPGLGATRETVVGRGDDHAGQALNYDGPEARPPALGGRPIPRSPALVRALREGSGRHRLRARRSRGLWSCGPRPGRQTSAAPPARAKPVASGSGETIRATCSRSDVSMPRR
jgi:hypothetical protein